MIVRDCSSWQEAQNNAPGGCSLGGWCTAEERELFFQMAKAMQPGQNYVEIGIYGGGVVALVSLAAPDGVRVFGIDPLDDEINNTHLRANGERLFTLADRNISMARSNARFIESTEDIDTESPIIVIVRKSQDIGEEWLLPITVLRVDGDHSVDGALSDLRLYAKHIVPGGLLLVDNFIDMQEVQDATNIWLAEQPPGEWIEVYRAPSQSVGTTLWLRRMGEPAFAWNPN